MRKLIRKIKYFVIPELLILEKLEMMFKELETMKYQIKGLRFSQGEFQGNMKKVIDQNTSVTNKLVEYLEQDFNENH